MPGLEDIGFLIKPGRLFNYKLHHSVRGVQEMHFSFFQTTSEIEILDSIWQRYTVFTQYIYYHIPIKNTTLRVVSR